MIKFCTGGWRTLIGEEFTKENVRLVAQALANIINNENILITQPRDSQFQMLIFNLTGVRI